MAKIDDRIAIPVTDRHNLVRSALLRGRVVKRVGSDSGWEIVDPIFAKYTGGPYPQRRGPRGVPHGTSARERPDVRLRS